MPGLTDYLSAQQPAPGTPNWLQLIAQSNAVPPDQAQQQMGLAPYLKDQPGEADARARSAPPPAPNVQALPMVDNYLPGQGIGQFTAPATKAMDRAFIDQYKQQSQDSMNAQKSGIGQLEQYAKDFQNKPVGINWTGLASLSDQMNSVYGHKTNLADAAEKTAPMNQDEKNDKLLKLQEYIQQAKGNMSSEDLKATQQMLQMIHQNDTTNLTAQHYANLERAMDAKTDMYGNRISSSQQMAAQRQFLNDPINKTYTPRYDGAIKLMDLIDGAERGDYKSNKALLGQMNAEISRLETGSQSPGLGASEKTEMNDAAATVKDLYDTLKGGVTGVDLSAKFQQARGMVGNLAQSYRSQIDSRNKLIAAGATKAQVPIFEAKAKSLSDEYDSRLRKLSPTSQTALGMSPAANSGVPAVGTIMDGHKFLGGDPSNPKSWEQQ